MKAETIYNQSDIDKQIAALHRERDAKAESERQAEQDRRKTISALGREHDLMNEANAAIVNNLSPDQYEAASIVQKLQADKRALEKIVAEAGRLPRRGALLSDPANARTDKLLDALNEAQRLNDPQAKYRAIEALRKNRKETSE
jgi:hypothetical protein